MANQATHHGIRRKIALVETSAPPGLSIVLEKIPDDLKWKFMSNYEPEAARYWLKLADETQDERHGRSLGLREMCPDKHQENIQKLKKQLKSLLTTSLKKKSEYTFWCEARFGKVDWRASQDDLQRNLTVKDISTLRNREFYTRTTTRTKDMTDKFQTLCSIPIGEPMNTVVLTVEDTTASDEVRYKISLDEYQGKLSFKSHEACEQHTVNLERYDTDFICVGRSYDVRISSACKFKQSMPPEVVENVEEIRKSTQRTDDGKLKMILKHGSVKVMFVRQMRTWNIILDDQKHDVHFYEVRETNTELLPDDEVVELEHNDNQEIEVKLIREVNKPETIDEILTEVEKLVDFAMYNVVDMAEECKDPVTPY